MMLRTYIFILILSFVSLSCNSKSGKRNETITDNSLVDTNKFYTVKKVVDGDTFWVDDFDDENSKGLKIRLIGIDAPESRKTFKKEIGFYGKEAKEYLTNLLSGQKVILEYDLNRTDQYGRTLAYVYLEDGTFVNAELVKNGYAMTMTIPPNVKFADEFVKLQQEARKFNRGLWKE
jgi:micrococcal nuclease